MCGVYGNPFKKFVKKQTRPFQLAIEDEVEKVLKNPGIGVEKSGDLVNVRVHKFKFHKQEYLMAYRVYEKNLFFYSIGVHENFYRNLKRHLKEGTQ
jgi:mRNA-degrading endonuclease RelE of RelBE toxin-antitoxin system